MEKFDDNTTLNTHEDDTFETYTVTTIDNLYDEVKNEVVADG